MIPSIAYSRVSSREQEREGYSIPAQRKLLAGYARGQAFHVQHEFIDVESAKNPGRKQFGEMLRLLESPGAPRIVLVEKTDRLYRNRTDALAFEALIENRGIEIHLVKEGRIIGKNSRSQDKFMHDIHVAVAKHYVENLKEEVKKGMREKAEQGFYPGRAPMGYTNNRVTRAIEVHPERAVIVQRIFELYGSGNHSLVTLRIAIRDETGIRINRSYLETVLKNPFYIGKFLWRGEEFKGNHGALISKEQFQRVQDVFAGRHKAKVRKHNFAFAGLLECAYDGCTVTSELQKGQYVYYRCSHGRGKCALPYMREEKVSEQLGQLVKDIYVPEQIAQGIVASLGADRQRSDNQRKERLADIQQRLSALRTRIDKLYDDKLDGQIDEEFWSRKQREYQAQERALEASAEGLGAPVNDENLLNLERIFELANKAYSLYLTRNSADRGGLLKSILLNCTTDGVNLVPTYRKPFDVIFKHAKSENWSGREDLNLRPPGPEPGALPG